MGNGWFPRGVQGPSLAPVDDLHLWLCPAVPSVVGALIKRVCFPTITMCQCSPLNSRRSRGLGLGVMLRLVVVSALKHDIERVYMFMVYGEGNKWMGEKRKIVILLPVPNFNSNFVYHI